MIPCAEAVVRTRRPPTMLYVAECPAFAAIRLKVLGTPVIQGTLHWSTQIAEFPREINFSSLQDQRVE